MLNVRVVDCSTMTKMLHIAKIVDIYCIILIKKGKLVLYFAFCLNIQIPKLVYKNVTFI